MHLSHPVFIGTFHKTGTILFTSIVTRMAAELGLSLWQPDGAFWRAPGAPVPDCDIVFDGGSRFLWRPNLFGAGARAVISIRDPRDVVISCALYHPTSQERWVVAPSEKYGGLSYQQALRALPDDDARMIFEMDHAAARTIAGMLRVDPADPRICLTRLDRLMVDTDLIEFHRLFTFLGFQGPALNTCLAIARDCSVFSGNPMRAGHVRHNGPAIWKRRFTPVLAAAFEARFPGAAERLGYEPTFPR